MALEDIVTILKGTGFECNTYIIKGDSLVLVDPGTAENHAVLVQQITSAGLNPQDISLIINTHCHYDHAGGDAKLKELCNAKLAIHSLDKLALENPDSETTCASLFEKTMTHLVVDQNLEEGDVLAGFKVLHTPGHTTGSICLYHEIEKILISGDTIFNANSFGRTDLPSGSAEQLKASLEKLSKLDIKIILPGHEAPTLENGSESIKSVLGII